MTREQLVKELKKRGYNFNKLIFKKVSPFYPSQWEAWLYNGKSNYGWLIMENDFYYKDKEYQLANVEAFNN